MKYDVTFRIDCGDLDVQEVIDVMWNAAEPLAVVIDAEAEEVVE